MFILVMGVTGSGKTTVGRLLAAALGWPFYDADDFHSADNIRKMASGVPLTDEDRRPWLQQLRALMNDRGHRAESGVLACSALKQSYRTILCGGGDVTVIYLKAQPDLIRSRLASRSGHYMSPSLIASQFRDLEEPTEGFSVDANQPPEQIVHAIRSKLGSGRRA